MTGAVINTGCYMSHNAKGASHAACAAMCAKLEVSLAIVDDSGKIYLPVAADHRNQNTRLMPFIEKRVKVTGTALDKGGVSGIALKTVELARSGLELRRVGGNAVPVQFPARQAIRRQR